MKGLELSRRYYKEYGAPMIHEQFPEYESCIAVGLVGSGSECFGFDDEISQDHDFEPGFCMFIPDESIVDSRAEFRMERAYAKLPNEFLGFKRQRISPVGGNRHGVIRINNFYKSKIGRTEGLTDFREWLSVPEFYLAEATNGEVFRDDSGQFTSVRNALLNMPEDIRRKRLAANLLTMAQSGQYNYTRCLGHGEAGSAQLALNIFVDSAIAVVFSLNNRYVPFYKWKFRAMRNIPILAQTEPLLNKLLTGENDTDGAGEKQSIIETIADMIIDELKRRNLTKAVCNDLEKHAYSVNDTVNDATLRNENIFIGL
jgi:hypothetical protein